jgi:hypothetical protein
MKRISISILLCFILTNIFCQGKDIQKPDYEGINKVITNAKSEFFYPTLFKRYMNSDSTLSVREFRVLYYGFLFNKSFTNSVSDKLFDRVNSILDKEKLTLTDYKKIIQYEKSILVKFPFNLHDLNLLAYAYLKKGDYAAYKQTINKYNLLFKTIMSTGDGTSTEKAYHVISISHEYDILQGLGFHFGGSQSLENGCDYLTVEKNKDDVRGIYFDVSMILNNRLKSAEVELEAIWLLDGVPLYTDDEKNKIEMKKLSINLVKQKVIDCSGHTVYDGCIQVTTADSVHTGLKYILKKTKNWILMHPLADFEVNGVIVNKNIILKNRLFIIKPELIEKVEIVEPNSLEGNCSNGFIRIKTK